MKQILTFLFLLSFAFVNAVTINVPTPYATIQDGIDAAANGDTVLVQPGTYVENINYFGKLITVGSLFLTTQDTSYISTTIIDGNSSGSVVTFENSEDSTTLLSGFTITNGSANYGGGIYCADSSPSLKHIIITGNYANDYGGGIYCYLYSSPVIENVTIVGNAGTYYGGGIFSLDFSFPSLYNVTIINNSANAGGGVACYNSNLSLINSILWNNSQSEIFNYYSSITITYSDIQGGYGGTGNIDSDPLFADPDNGDYHLSWANFPIPDATMSPCIDAGDPASPFDPDGTVVEIGAYFFPQFIIANFTADTTIGNLPLTVNFTDLSVQGTSVIDEWFWDFGDGNNSTLQDPSNEYLLPGIYTVSLTVTDVNDSTDTETKVDYITVNYLPPIADFTADTTNGEVSLMVNFTDTSEQGTGVIDEWYWDFGDGNNSTLQNPANEYLLPGIYTVSLTITDVNDLTDTETKVDYITVTPPAYNGPIWHISTTGSDISGNGSTQYPFATIQHGINASADTDTVLVQPGTYVENINYNGKLITVGSLFLTTQDSTYISSTIIDGNSNGSVVTFENGEISTAVFCGFTITNGLASGSWPENCGGGISCAYTSPSLENLKILGNTSAIYGGGISCYQSNPNLENVTLIDNTAINGGGIYCANSSPSLQNLTIIDNSAIRGGGIFCTSSSSSSLDNVTISGNSADRGGGIYCSNNSNPSLENVTISGNSANDGGSGIYCYGNSNPILKNSILWNDSPEEIYIESGSVTATYSNIQGGWTGTGNIDSDPLFADPANGDYHLSWANFPVPDATMSPCIDTGDPSSPLDPDATIADMGAYYFDKSPGAPVITAVTDVPDDQGRYVQLIWDRSPYDAPGSPVTIESYSVWRYDDIFGDRGIFEIYEDPREIFEKAAKDNDKNYYWQRDDEILTFITQLPAMGFAQYSVVAPTIKDSSVVSINYSAFKVFAHTDITLIYFPSLPDSGYSVDNIAPDETDVYIAQNGTNIGLNWDEVEYGTFQGNSYPEINGIWYKIYAGDFSDFVCDEAHLIDTVTDLNYDYPLAGEEKKFFKIVVSDQPEAGRYNNLSVPLRKGRKP